MRTRRDTSGLPTTFLQKTFSILDNPDLHRIICWNDSGTSFLVKNVTELCEDVLPVYFKHSNYASFVRQLNMYDFHKVREGLCDNAFKHPLFRRDKPELLKDIRRKTAEHNGTIVPVGQLSRSNSEELEQKLYTVQRKQHQMELQIQSLEERNTEVLEYNKNLFHELCYYKDREQKIENLLMVFASYIQNMGRKDAENDVHDLILSLGAQHPPMLMDDDAVKKRAKTSPPPSDELDEFDFLLGEQS